MDVIEIFFSIQGESSYQGCPCVFIRLAGCNLSCSYCDSLYAHRTGDELTPDDVIERIAVHPCRLVEITGGEPLLQKDTPLLAAGLLERGYRVLVETNGTVDVSVLDPRVITILDLKCPGSGHHHEILWENLNHLTGHDEIKFVITSREDYVWTRNTIEKRGLTGSQEILLSPAHELVAPSELASWIIEDGLDVRLNLQIHKYIWDPGERGR